MQTRKHISIYAMFNLEQFEKSSQTMQRRMRMAANQMKSVGQTMSLSISAPIVASMGYATAEFAKFEQSMAKVNAVSGATASEMGKLTKLAEDLGISTRYTASQVSDLELNYAKLGFSPKLIEEITESTLDLALATGGDLADSAMVAGATLRGFGLEGNEMQRVVDVMAKSFTSSALDLEKFSVSISKIAPIAAVTGRTIEEVAAQQSVLADTGVEASIIGTSLRKIYGDLAKSGMSYNEAMDKIRSSTNKVATATKLFDIRAANAAIILSEQEDKVNMLTKSYENAEGEAKRMAEIMNDTLQMSVIRLKSAVEGLAISFGEIIAPRVRKIADFLADMARGFADLSPNVKKAIVTFSGLLAVGGPVLVMLGSLSLAITAVGSTVAATAAGIVVLVAAYGGLMDLLSGTQEAIKKTSVIQLLNESATKKMNDSLEKERDEYRKLYVALRSTTHGTEERRLALKEMNKTHGTHLKDIKDEKGWLDQLSESYKDVVSQMEKKAIANMHQSEMENLVKAREGIQKNIDELKEKRFFITGEDVGGSVAGINSFKKMMQSHLDDLKEVQDRIDVINEKFKKKPKVEETDVDGDEDTLISKETDPLAKVKMNKMFTDDLALATKTIQEFQDQATSTAFIVANGWSFMTESMLSEFDKIPEKLTSLEKRLKDFTDDVNAAIQGMVQDAVYGLADLFGQMAASGDDFNKEDFGKGVLEMVAGFMQQLGGLMITWGISFDAFQKSITAGPAGPAIAIAAGIAMVAAGAAIKGTLNKGLDGGSSVTSPSSYGSSSAGVSFGNQDIVSTVRIEGREMIITQKRENNFRR